MGQFPRHQQACSHVDTSRNCIGHLACRYSGLSAYERERNNRIRENNRLLKALGLMATDYSVATVKDAHAVLAAPAQPVVMAAGGATESATTVPGGTRLSFACIPPLELPAAAELPDDVAAYRRAVVDATVAVAGRLCLGGVLAVGVHDLRRRCTHCFPAQRQVAVLWPLAVLVWHDLRSTLPPWMALKEMVIVVPRQHGRRRYACARRCSSYAAFGLALLTGRVGLIAIPVRYRDHPYEPTAYAGHANAPPLLPIVHGTYLVFVKRESA